MRRRAILIGNNTGYRAPTFLKGVTKDLVNYRDYLKGGIGGAWEQYSEIKILHNQGRSKILSAIKGCHGDYSFVVFSGHGFVNSKDGLTYVCAADGYVSEDELNTYLGRQTLILDCCREASSMENFLGDIGESFEKGGPSRGISGIRRTIVNQLSGDNPSSGGVFSSALIRAGLDFGKDNSYEYSWMAIKAAVQHAGNYIYTDPFTTQEPEYSMRPSNMELTCPFALTNKIQKNRW